MDVGQLWKARSGSAFLDCGTGDVRIKIFGDQDEDVDIDDGDSDTAHYIDASLAGVCLPVTSTEVDTALPSDIPEREHLQENTVSSPSHQSEVSRSAHGSWRNDHATNQNAGSERNRSDAPGMLAFEKFPNYLFWPTYANHDQFVGERYKNVKEICDNCTPRPAPLVNVPTTPQPVLVPEITPLRTSSLNHPPIAGFEPSPGNVLPQAITATEPARNQLGGSQGTGRQVETEILLPESQSVEENPPGDNALEAEGAQAVVEPVSVEVGTDEVVLVEAVPRLVPEEPLDMLISQSRVPESEPIQVLSGTITSSDSSLEQGLGWVLLSPVPEISVGDLISQSRVSEYEPIHVLAGTITSGDSSLEQGLGWVLPSPVPEISVGDLSLTGQPMEVSGSERVSNSESHIGSSQSDEGGPASATLGAFPMEVPRHAGSVTGHVYPDVLLKDKENLSIEDLEKAKAAYESEAQRIKAEYHREAEILHEKYQALLVEQHRSFTRHQQEVQLNILKLEWDEQLAEALELQKKIAACTAVFTGLATQTAVQPLVNQQAPQQISGRPRTTEVPEHVHASISRSPTNTVNAGSGMAGQSECFEVHDFSYTQRSDGTEFRAL